MEKLIFITVNCFFLLSFVMHKERVYNSELETNIPSVGKQIAEARLKKGLTQTELASILDISVYSIQSIEKGKAVPVRGMIHKIQKVLDCEVVMDGPFKSDGVAMSNTMKH